ncbi:MAG TPA: hypothetical protein VF612_08675 [Jatrophihabitans sp.]|uniref:hypothetical protein n=1 Tax=Jatrophihabitans sp. TaxID=1932789 RepID=UPI002F0089EE
MTQPTPPHDRPPPAGSEPGSESGSEPAGEPGSERGSESGGRPPRDRSAARLAAGAVLLVLALVLFASARVVAAGQRHAYDPAANPPPAYHLTAGKTYQLSSTRSVAELKKAGLLTDLACYATTSTGVQTPVALASTAEDDRNLHLFATMVAPSTGEYRLSCTGIPQVFVDDADNAAPDRSAPLVLLSILVGLLGVIAACSGGYGVFTPNRRQPADR